MKKDLGRAGENKFVSWCSDVGITINKAEEDKHGWDFLLEFPVSRTTGAAHDLHKSNMICKVQVKSTEGKRLAKKVELSNLHALATDPLPVFYLFLHFNKNDANPSDAYFLHLDDSLIRRILKTSREYISAGEGRRLNKRTLTIKYGETHRIREASGQGLLKHIEENYHKNWGNLIRAKQKTLDTAGFEEGAVSINFKIKEMAQKENLILGSLGYPNRVSVSDLSLWHNRFGIKDPRPAIAMPNAIMTMECAESSRTRVMITCPAAETLVLPAKLYFSPLINSLDKVIFRISTDFIDIRVDAGTGKIDVESTIEDEKAYSLALLRKVIIFLKATLTSQCEISVFFEHEGEFLQILKAHTNPTEKEIEELVIVIDYLRDLLKDSFDLSQIEVRPSWLRENFGALREILALKMGHGKFSFKLDNEKATKQHIPSRAHFFHYRTFTLESVSYIFIFSAQCERSSDADDECKFVGEFKIIKETEGPNSESWVNGFLNSELVRLSEELIEVGSIYLDGYWSEISSAPFPLILRES